MSDVEWYVEIEGQRTGPVSPSDLVAMYQTGRLPGNAMATTARMQGDWVTIADLVEAYRELNQSTKPASSSSYSSLSDSAGPSFQAPPRPTEQLEASKIINLNTPPPSEAPMDATESLFLAIQAVREKAAAKNAVTQTPITLKSSTYQKDPTQGRNQLIVMLIIVFMTGAYGVTQLLKSDSPKPEAAKTETTPPPTRESYSATETKPSRPVTNTSSSGGPKSKLLTEGGGGAVRTAPPVNTITNPVMPRGGGAVRMGESEKDSRETNEARDRRDLRDYSRDTRDTREVRENNAPTIRDEFGETVDRIDGESAENQKNRDVGAGIDRAGNPEDDENDATYPHTMEGVAPEQ